METLIGYFFIKMKGMSGCRPTGNTAKYWSANALYWCKWHFKVERERGRGQRRCMDRLADTTARILYFAYLMADCGPRIDRVSHPTT